MSIHRVGAVAVMIVLFLGITIDLSLRAYAQTSFPTRDRLRFQVVGDEPIAAQIARS